MCTCFPFYMEPNSLGGDDTAKLPTLVFDALAFH